MQPLNDISGRLSAPREGRLTPDDGLVCERMDLGDGLAVCRVSGRPSRAVMLAAPDEAEERVHLQLLSAGACRFLDRQGEHDLSAGAGTRFLSPGRGAAWTVSPGDRLDVLSIDVSGPRVARWFQDEGCDRVDWRDRLSAPSRQDAAALSRLSALMALRMKRGLVGWVWRPPPSALSPAAWMTPAPGVRLRGTRSCARGDWWKRGMKRSPRSRPWPRRRDRPRARCDGHGAGVSGSV